MYYSISRSDDIKEIGYYPQSDLRKGYNPRNNGHFVVKHYEFPDFKPNLELEMHPKASPTNYLDSTAGLVNGFVVDRKLKELLMSFKLPKHHFYPIKVYKQEMLLEYYWFHYIIDDFWKFLDKEKSYAEVVFMETPTKIGIEKNVPIYSREQIIGEKRKLPRGKKNLRISKIVMKKEFPNYDFYEIDCLSYNTIISEKLRDSIIKASLTGMKIKPFDKFIIDE